MEVFNERQCSLIATEIIEGAAISAYGVLDVKPVDGRFGGRVFEINDMVEKPKLEEAPPNLPSSAATFLRPRSSTRLRKSKRVVEGNSN
jgi:UTP--glucose-1-phosphate uridylyltransferase